MDIWQVVHDSAHSPPPEWGGTPSVAELARFNAEVHRWHESQRIGRDAGPDAFQRWIKQHWKRFCRWRYVEHLLGLCRYREFQPEMFGFLRNHQDWRLDSDMEFVLLETLLDDREQLELLALAPEAVGRPRMMAILRLLNLDAARLHVPDWGSR